MTPLDNKILRAGLFCNLIAAPFLFSTAWVGVVFVGWFLWIVYDFRRIMRKFQFKKEFAYEKSEKIA